jgi:hypothetical protein
MDYIYLSYGYTLLRLSVYLFLLNLTETILAQLNPCYTENVVLKPEAAKKFCEEKFSAMCINEWYSVCEHFEP